MRKLANGEVYTKSYANNSDISNAVTQQLFNNIGVITPEHIEAAIIDLKTRSKKSSTAFLSEAISLFETRGLIRLFNLSSANGGKSRIPSTIPFIRGVARNRYSEDGGTGRDTVLFVNMYRIGNWNADDTQYIGFNPSTDLYSCLESGVIAYKLTVQNYADVLFSNKSVLEYLTKIYVRLFSAAVIRAKTTFGSNEFQKDAANFLIARFFLLYVLEKQDNETVDDFAYLTIQNHSSLVSLKSFEEVNNIQYDTLSHFLETFGAAFFNGEPVYLVDFENKWVQSYGDSTGLAVEYAPFLIHFLIATFHGASFNGTLRLARQRQELEKIGLSRLYNAIVGALK